MNAALKKRLILTLPYILMGLLCTKLSEAVRLATGSTFSEKVLHISDGLAAAFQSWLPSLHPVDLLAGLIAGGLFALAVTIKHKNAKKFRHNVEHGSARWGTAKDIAPFKDPDPANNIILTQTEQLTMNNRPKDPATARNKNVLVVGGSGSGKTRFEIKPNLLQCTSEKYPCSFVVTDPKGDVVVDVGKALQKHGYAIRILNLIDTKKSNRYNPFAYIHSEKDILKFVDVLIANTSDPTKTGGDEFWTKAEKLLYLALIGYIHYEAPEEEQNMTTLVDMINSMEVREDDELFMNRVDLLFMELEDKNPNHFAVRLYKEYKLAAGKTAKSILISAAARLSVFNIQEVRDLTEYDELGIDTLGDRKTALFIIMPETDKSLNFIISIFFTQLFDVLCEKAYKVYGGRLPVHVRCLIDEAANIGKIPELDTIVSIIRSREISVMLIYQALSQLKSRYKETADTIIGNMDSFIFLGGNESSTTKELSEMLGKATIDTYNTGENRGKEVSHSLNYQKLGRELMARDELAVMPRSHCILQLSGVRPFYSRKYNYPKHPLYGLTADADKKNAFDVEAYLKHKPKLRMSDAYQVVSVDLTGVDTENMED